MIRNGHLQDAFGRQHDYLRISLTERCNLRCTYCMPEDGIQLSPRSEIMTLDEIDGISKVFVGMGVKTIRLTGGEPMVRKGFDTILERLSRLPVALKITTNGILIDKYADHLVDAGITSLNVSIDTLRKDRFQAITRRDYFDRVMKNIGLATRSGMDVVLNVVLMRGKNDDEIPAFVQYACDRGIRIKFIEFMPFQRNEWSLSKSVGEQEVLQVINQSFSRVKKLMDPPNSTSQNYQVGGSGRFGVVSTVTNPFCGTCNRIRLTANGKLKNCLFSNGETDILTSYRQGLDIQPLIRNALAQKKWSRGGMNSNDDFNDTKAHQGNRPMIAIGG